MSSWSTRFPTLPQVAAHNTKKNAPGTEVATARRAGEKTFCCWCALLISWLAAALALLAGLPLLFAAPVGRADLRASEHNGDRRTAIELEVSREKTAENRRVGKNPTRVLGARPTRALGTACFNRHEVLSTMAPLRNAIRVIQSTHKLEVRK